MKNILDKIVERKKEEVALALQHQPITALKDKPAYHAAAVSAAQNIRSGIQPAVITEFKRCSPSKGWIKEHAEVKQIVPGYAGYGAAAISVLTDTDFFGGSLADFELASSLVDTPLLRKDFTIHSYQLHEAKAYGADLILLIAAILSPAQVQELAEEAKSIGLEVLLELHGEDELSHVCDAVDMVGINNRNLKNFEVNLDHSIRMAQALPTQKLRIAESGIHSAEAALYLKQHGFDGFLIGEYFMKQPDPAIAFAEFLNAYKQLSSV
ncbi:MAG TPA: indole-3-glycerol phosphate synthase TrpC [Phnomibacter sp.]|nr:indole-3-glycerol phosphate synthase TrpC [Phnomibacter sp.]